MNRVVIAVVIGSRLMAPGALLAQDSQFGVRGLGTPGQFTSVRARATGGAFGLFDPLSPAGEAALADLRVLTTAAVVSPAWRNLDFGATTGSANATRFPLVAISAPIRVRDEPRVTISTGFTTYLDRSFQIVTSREDTIRNSPVTVTDTVASDGAVVDLRVAGAYRMSDRVRVGVAVHRLVGSARGAIHRTFSDSLYRSYVDSNDVGYEGFGFSAGALVDLLSTVRAAVSLRTDGSLRSETRQGEVSNAGLPVTVAAGLQWLPNVRLRVAAAGTWRSWSTADAAVQVNGGHAFDTFQWNVGAEWGRDRPLRIGFRQGSLPFSPTTEQPTEWAAALGTSRLFAGGRAVIDLALERASRSGPGLEEKVWTLLVGVSIRP
jgi:hypothetical protein